MPLPDHPFLLTGGCSCGAIRYRIQVPQTSDRPPVPWVPPESKLTLPSSITCHCNDCRRASASILAAGVLQIPGPMLTVSALSPSESEPEYHTGRILDVMDDAYDAAVADSQRPPYLPATDVLRAAGEQKTWLRFFHSFNCGPNAGRGFCGRCGTPLSYHFRLIPSMVHGGKLPDGWVDIFDIYLGSIDKEFLAKDWLLPTSEINFKHGSLLSRTVSATARDLKGLLKMQGLLPGEGLVDQAELEHLAR